MPARLGPAQPAPGADVIARAMGALALMALAVIHVVDLPATLGPLPLVGVGYFGIIAAALGVSGALIARSHLLVWAAAGAVAVMAMGGYVLTRALPGGFLGDHGDVGNWRCPLGVAALSVETLIILLVALAAWLGRIPAASPANQARPAARRARVQPARLIMAPGWRRSTNMRMSSPGPPGRASAASWRRWLLPAAIAAGFVILLTLPRGTAPGTALSYTQFLADVSAGTVRAVTISPAGQVTGTLAGGHPFTTTIPVALGGDGLAGDLAAHHVQVTAITAMSSSLLPVLTGLLPVLLFGGLLYLGIRKVPLSSGGGLGGLGGLAKARAQVIDAERPATRFTDVAGYATVKTEVSEVVDYLRDPGRYHRAGARGPRGVLMTGPPGTGKTLLARAVAGEAQVPFLSVSGSGFVEMFVGVGAARVRDLFEQARTRGPAIVFIDEIDALGARRDHGGFAGSDEREQTLNQLLAEMDGFGQSAGVVVLAATNRPDALDPALRRPGRFDREVIVPLPGRAERSAILAAHARGKNLGPGADLDQVAAATPGFSGADLANLVNEAAVTAVRAGRTTLTAADFASARDRVLLGTRHSSPLAPGELATVAVHEAGHALVATLSPYADPVSRVTILGAGQALGLTETLPADDRRLYGERYLADTLAVRLGGRAAERLIRGEASTGAADDLASATALATQMVREFGLSEAVGPVSYSGPPAGYPGLAASRAYSEHTQWLVDQEVAALLTNAESRARDLLTSHRETLTRLAAALLEQETVTGDQVRALAQAASPAPAGEPSPTNRFSR